MLKLYILFFWKRSPLDIFINAFLPPPSRFQILDATSVPSMSCIDSSQQLCHSGAPAQNASCTRDSIAPFYFISALLHAVILYMRHPSASIFSSTCTALESEFSLIFTSIFFFPCAPVERQFSMATLAVDSQAVTRRRSQLLGEYIRIAISSYCQITASICPQLPFSSEFILQILLRAGRLSISRAHFSYLSNLPSRFSGCYVFSAVTRSRTLNRSSFILLLDICLVYPDCFLWIFLNPPELQSCYFFHSSEIFIVLITHSSHI